jgi:NAD+ diphosphatase
MTRINFYAGARLDRNANRRDDQAWYDALLADPRTRIVPVWRSQNLVIEGAAPAAAFLERARADALLRQAGTVALLGLIDDIAHVAIDLSHLEEAAAHAELAAAQAGVELATQGSFTDLRRIGPLLERGHGSVLAYARGLMHWHARHGFCGVCGAATRIVQAGHVRQCTNADCNAQHFPRTDPAVIMLVEDRAGPDGPRCLLGRQKIWVPGMHSTLAGFVEPGESLEEAVAREVFEEVGIAVDDVRYHSSQPWPFPASIMLGFYARARTTEIQINPDELEAALWVTKADIADFPNRGMGLPRMDSIARRLVEDWLAGV